MIARDRLVELHCRLAELVREESREARVPLRVDRPAREVTLSTGERWDREDSCGR